MPSHKPINDITGILLVPHNELLELRILKYSAFGVQSRKNWALRMLAHGGASSHHGSDARRCGIGTADQSGLQRPA